ncbi:MAG: OmpA family protein, partial [Acidobacteria bacterium]|nr:OmpA family protein [Acidobacteriota bacterium]
MKAARTETRCAGLALLAALAWWAAALPLLSAPGHDLEAVEVPGGALISFPSRGSTTVLLRGTERLPAASGAVKVESRGSYLEIELRRGALTGLEAPGRFGADFLTYVLWAVTADGTAVNLGEVTFEGDRSSGAKFSAPYHGFALMLTAEPNFAVRQPSPVVVLVSQRQEQALRVPATLVYYTSYRDYNTTPAAPPAGPLELLEARKGVELAARLELLTGAAADSPLSELARARELLRTAQAFLDEAEGAYEREGASATMTYYARTGVELAESARALAVGAAGTIQFKQLEKALEDTRRQHAEAREQVAATRRELTSLQDRFTQLEAALDRERRHSRELESEILALRERIGLLEPVVDRLREEKQALEQDRGQLCRALWAQLGSLGQVTEQGGVVALTLASDALFDIGRYELSRGARESLARLAALRPLLFPDAVARYEGHTDLVGEEDYNQWLSEQRALSVYQYILQQRRSAAASEEEQAQWDGQLRGVEQLLAMNYNVARRQAGQRQELLAALGHKVVGKGLREPLVPER